MPVTTYVATDPAGGRHERARRTPCTHAVLEEGPDGWEAVAFFASAEAAERRMGKADNRKVVEVAAVEPAGARPTVGALVARLVTESAASYAEVVEEVRRQFPEARTTARSVASTAARLRRSGVDVPMRSALSAG
ncbi:MAG: hypothetical protein AAF845_16825 [Bacteroidota bacterium]